MQKNYLLKIHATPLFKDESIERTINAPHHYEIWRKELRTPEETWELLGKTAEKCTSWSDTTWSRLRMGYYQYGLRALYASGASQLVPSPVIGKDLTTELLLHIQSNAGEEYGNAKIQLTSHKTRQSYTIDHETNYCRGDLPKDIYSLSASLDGFRDIAIDTLDLTQKSKYEVDLLFQELTIAPYNLKVKVAESAPFNCSFSWNEDNFILDNFDAYAPFTLEPATKDKNWIYWDLDKRKTVSFEGVQFPHAEEETSFMVFNPYHTDPKVAFFDEKSLSLSGNQYLAAFSCQQGTAANYLFSPLLAYDGDLHFGFFAKSFTDAYGKEIIRVGYTPEAYPKDHNAIIWLSEPIELQEKSWRKYDFSLPPEAKRAVVAHLSKEAFYIMLDNVYVGEPSPFADGIVNKPLQDRATYSLLVDDKEVATDLKTCSYQLDSLASGEHTAEVRAFYKSGAHYAIRKGFTIKESNSSPNVAQEAIIIYPNPCDKVLYIHGTAERWELYDAGGTLRLKGNKHYINTSSLPLGSYILKLYTPQDGIKIQKIVKQ